MFKEVMGKYPPPMAEVLAEPEAPDEPKTCVDLGCGSGSWLVSLMTFLNQFLGLTSF